MSPGCSLLLDVIMLIDIIFCLGHLILFLSLLYHVCILVNFKKLWSCKYFTKIVLFLYFTVFSFFTWEHKLLWLSVTWLRFVGNKQKKQGFSCLSPQKPNLWHRCWCKRKKVLFGYCAILENRELLTSKLISFAKSRQNPVVCSKTSKKGSDQSSCPILKYCPFSPIVC